MTDTLIGIRGKDFVAVACDTYEKYSIITIKNDDESKISQIGKSTVLMLAGPLGDRVHWGEQIKRTMEYYKYKNSHELSASAAAHFIRLELSEYLRQSPYQVDMLIAGVDKDGPSLFWIDYLSSCTAVDTAVHGYGGFLLRGLLDKEYKPDMTREEAIALLKRCRHEVKNRFLLSQSNFSAKIIDEQGVHDVSIDGDETPEIFRGRVQSAAIPMDITMH
ncbi:proteasome beta 2 subunit, putative [Babesia bigemina]|uniref:Proteasome subunit beta n=1 Tax=Babesia bigemina TaxID=5866 RepID=A0A061DDW2_BABBI|nr:proteasome beta 2 subunit, putative [Babesia bigemina]CDR97739.1 proteasome beta 2 subunit, putative [Babesia bigemina]|eukprot:XP_012769925.1 proteasome beta 2 subunit, putative [Babesia bigemina]